MLKTPIVYICFNRSKIVEKTFKFIERQKPIKLYIIMDGPRLNNKSDENEILKIAEKAFKKWDINYVSIIHRIGRLFPKDKIVYVGVSSKHRQNAFNACNFIMDYLKTNATFWKLEEFENKNKWVIQDKKEIEALEKWS